MGTYVSELVVEDFECTPRSNETNRDPLAIDKNLHTAGVVTFFITDVYSIGLTKYASISVDVFSSKPSKTQIEHISNSGQYRVGMRSAWWAW